MASPNGSHHLLTIPREIRNQVYSYLYTSIELRTVEYIGTTKVIVGLTNAPLLDVLLVHPQLHHEYKESDSFKNLTATVVNVSRYAAHARWTWSIAAKTAAQDNAALTHLKHITLLVLDAHSGNISALVDALALKSPSITTLMIEEDALLETFTSATLPPDLHFPAPDALEQLPATLVSLPLRQRVDCRWISTARQRAAWGEVEHQLVQIRMHVYSAARPGGFLWTRQRLEESEVPREYARLVRKVLSRYEADYVRHLPKHIIGWMEQRY